MKKSAILRPVSQKAYDRFVKRIYLVVTNKTKREAMPHSTVILTATETHMTATSRLTV